MVDLYHKLGHMAMTKKGRCTQMPIKRLLSVTNGKLLKTFASPQQLFVHRFNNPSKTRSSSKTYQTQPSILQVYLACCSCCICSTVLCLTTSSLSFSISSFCLSISSFAFPFHMSFATKWVIYIISLGVNKLFRLWWFWFCCSKARFPGVTTRDSIDVWSALICTATNSPISVSCKLLSEFVFSLWQLSPRPVKSSS